MYQVAVVIAQHLHFNMLWVFNVALKEYGGVAKGSFGFTGSSNQTFQQFFLRLSQ